MKRLREVEVTVIVPEALYAVDIASSLLMALRAHSEELAIRVKICPIEEEDEEPGDLTPKEKWARAVSRREEEEDPKDPKGRSCIGGLA